MERFLAHIEIVKDVQPCPNADRLDLIHVLGWQLIAARDEFKAGDMCVYIEIDSKVDITRPEFAFMSNYDGKVKTRKFRGQLSQGIALPLEKVGLNSKSYKIGDDVTAKLGIAKIETQEQKRLNAEGADPRLARVKQRYSKFLKTRIGKWLMKHKFTRELILMLGGKKKVRKDWPAFVQKTDEERIENIPWELDNKEELIATQKLDGTSTTFFIKRKYNRFIDGLIKFCTYNYKPRYEFGVCSRNVRQFDEKQKCYHDHNIYWDMAFKYNVEAVLNTLAKRFDYPDYIVLQGESVGSVQGNPLKLKEDDFYGYNLIIDGEKHNPIQGRDIMKNFGIKWVPILDEHFVCPDTMEEMKALADGESVISPNGTMREGIVYRSYDAQRSFKNVSNKYLLKHGE